MIAASTSVRLRRALGLRDLLLYGLVTIQLTAPMPIYGVLYNRSNGHTVAVVLLSMIAMLLTAVSYGRMASAHPSAGGAFAYASQEIHPAVGYVTGWAMAMDYMLIPILSTIWCSKQAGTFFPAIPFPLWALFFVCLFSGLNLRGIRASARTNILLAAVMAVVILAFLFAAVRAVLGEPSHPPGYFLRPLYNPETFTPGALLGGTSVAVLTYLGFDAISTLSEEVKNPRRNILLATVLSCLIIGVLSAIQVYAAQLVGPNIARFENIETAFVQVAGHAGGPVLFSAVGIVVLVATFGSALGSQLGAARLLYAMGRAGTLPRSFFGALHPVRRVPANNVLFVGGTALLGAYLLNFDLGAELVNFGALLAFMGVNASALMRFYVRAPKKKLTYFLPSALGLAICFLLWLGLSGKAKLLGLTWLGLGLLWGAWRTRGFRPDLVSFEVHSEPENIEPADERQGLTAGRSELPTPP